MPRGRVLSEDEIEAVVIDVLRAAGRDLPAGGIDPRLNFRDQFEFDSMDFLNFGLGLEKRLGAKIPDSDFPRLSSLGGCVSYLCVRSKTFD